MQAVSLGGINRDVAKAKTKQQDNTNIGNSNNRMTLNLGENRIWYFFLQICLALE